MAFPTGNYSGLEKDDFETLSTFDAFAEWSGYFTPVADGEFYIFSGDHEGFLLFLQEIEEEYGYGSGEGEDGLVYFRYIKSTDAVHAL